MVDGHDDEDELALRRRQRDEQRAQPTADDKVTPLSLHLGTARMVRIRSHVPAQSTSGYLLGLSPKLALLHVFDDFEPDGFTIIDVAQVADLECGPGEELFDRILTGEGLLGGLALDLPIDLTSIASALGSLIVRHRDLIIETADDDGESTFYLGRVVALEDAALLLHAISHLGQWDEAASHLPYERIARIQFATPYLQLFMKYAPAQPPPLR